MKEAWTLEVILVINLNNVSNLQTSIFHEICYKIFNFFLTIRKIMTCSTSVSTCQPEKRSVLFLQLCSSFDVCSSQTQTNMVCSIFLRFCNAQTVAFYSRTLLKIPFTGRRTDFLFKSVESDWTLYTIDCNINKTLFIWLSMAVVDEWVWTKRFRERDKWLS